MSRTLIDIPQDKLEQIDTIAKTNHISRAALIRVAIGEYIANHQKPYDFIQAFGLLKDNAIDGLDLQRQLRREWR